MNTYLIRVCAVRMRVTTIALALVVIITPLVSGAQTACPVGVAAGSAQCGPSPAEHVNPGTAGDSGPSATRYVPTGEWKKTWGAVAIDSETGAVGATFGKRSKNEAERDALDRCRTSGSAACRVQIAYKNQCVATFFPSIPGQRGLSGSGATVEDATRRGAEKCRELNGNECNLVYTRCTEPIFDAY